MESRFVPGQRVLNEAEPDLGLGLVEEVPDARTVVVRFPATAQVRRYRLQSAPLRPVVLRAGQEAVARDGRRFRIESVEVREGLRTYLGDGEVLSESDLEDRIPLADALDRLRAGHLGFPGDLDLRREGWEIRSALLATRTRGLGSARVRLLDHQLDLAHRVSRMEAPRVLLADEVGLGKTIEAGLIFSALRALGRAGRVLIVVPESLVHQWLAEMVRRFHELFSVVGMSALGEARVFSSARRVLVPLGALQAGLLDEACRHRWDLLIVDEAHHLRLGQPSYAAIEKLAARSRGLLLLTGTPTRGGLENEFGLLHLVDPGRFPDLDSHLRERPQWKAAAQAARDLQSLQETTDPEHRESVLRALEHLYPQDRSFLEALEDFRSGRESGVQSLIEALIDRHGPGRVLFRNRRERLAGLFPGRHLHPVPLPRTSPGEEDPRLAWLCSFLDAHPEEKVLLIARRGATVLDLQESLRLRRGARAAVFHEGLPLVERDRQAAWFADPEGAQILLASEIGSEGRNFQFAHHLVMWDIPLHPDLIEQRIGRLDRIGQEKPVEIHALFREGLPEERLFRWHHEAVGSFVGPVEGSDEILHAVEPRQNLMGPGFPDFLERTRRLVQEHRDLARQNVDLLVDLNSFREAEGRALREEIEATGAASRLEEYLGMALERFGVQDEETATPGLYRIRPGQMMFVDSLPGLREDGMLATFSRHQALDREDLEYLTPDHPLVDGVLSMLLDGAEGSASAVRWRGAPAAGLVVQGLFLMEAIGPPRLELQRYLPPTPLLVSVDLAGRAWSGGLPGAHALERLQAPTVGALSARLGDRLEALVERAGALAVERSRAWREAALEKARRALGQEQARLEELHRVNPAVPAEEVQAHRARASAVLKALNQAVPRLDSLRLVLLEPGTS